MLHDVFKVLKVGGGVETISTVWKCGEVVLGVDMDCTNDGTYGGMFLGPSCAGSSRALLCNFKYSV